MRFSYANRKVARVVTAMAAEEPAPLVPQRHYIRPVVLTPTREEDERYRLKHELAGEAKRLSPRWARRFKTSTL